MLPVSVIVPTQNRAAILPETLRALARQSYPTAHMEVVVVDDGSNDGTWERIDPSAYPFLLRGERLEPRAQFCPARPRNDGLRAASGEVALFLDADVLAGPDLVAEHLAAHAAKGGPRAVIGYTYGYPRTPADRTPEALQPPPPAEMLDRLPELLERDRERWGDGRERIYAATQDLGAHPSPWQMFWTSNVSVPRSSALEVGGFDEEFVGWGAEDLEFAYRLYQHGLEFVLARGAFGVHYPHPVGDLAQRGAELQANRRRLIAKHPHPRLELRLWDSWPSDDAWNEIQPLLACPPVAGTAGIGSLTALLQRLQAEIFPHGPFLLCGPLTAGVPGFHPTQWCQPFPLAREPIGPCRRLPLLGVFTPWDDHAFAGAIVTYYWQYLTPALRAGLIRETIRVADVAALLFCEPPPSGSLEPCLRTRAECAEALDALATEFVWYEVEQKDLAAFTVRRRSNLTGDALPGTGTCHGRSSGRMYA